MTEKQSPNGWTLDTLAEHLTARINADQKYIIDLSNEREVRTSERFATSKEAVTSALAAAEKAIQAAMQASEKAIIKAELAAEKRSEASNEIRAAMMDQQKTFAEKSQTEFRLSTIEGRVNENSAMLNKRIENIDSIVAAMGGRTQGVGASTGVMSQVIMAVIAVAAIAVAFLHH